MCIPQERASLSTHVKAGAWPKYYTMMKDYLWPVTDLVQTVIRKWMRNLSLHTTITMFYWRGYVSVRCTRWAHASLGTRLKAGAWPKYYTIMKDFLWPIPDFDQTRYSEVGDKSRWLIKWPRAGTHHLVIKAFLGVSQPSNVYFNALDSTFSLNIARA